MPFRPSSATPVGNALRYTPASGTVHLAWRWLDDGRGEFAVLDTGPGIAAEHIPRLTERFYRVDSSRSRETGGTGLGLAIVKHVLQRHGAELLVESQVGQGPKAPTRSKKPQCATAPWGLWLNRPGLHPSGLALVDRHAVLPITCGRSSPGQSPSS